MEGLQIRMKVPLTATVRRFERVSESAKDQSPQGLAWLVWAMVQQWMEQPSGTASMGSLKGSAKENLSMDLKKGR